MWSSVREFLYRDDGPTSVEYCVMLAAILLTVIVSISAFGQAQNGYWGYINSSAQAVGF